MHAKTDYIVTFCLIFFFMVGWRKGLLRTLLDPFCLAVAWGIAFFVYQATQDYWKAIVSAMAGAVALKISIKLLLKFSRKKNDEAPQPSFLGGLIAGVINASWGGILLFLTLLILTRIHIPGSWGEKIQEDILKATTYRTVTGFWENEF